MIGFDPVDAFNLLLKRLDELVKLVERGVEALERIADAAEVPSE